MSLDIICRTCLRTQTDMKSVFESDAEFKIRFNDIIKYISQVEILQNDGISGKICKKCICELKRTYRFINQVQACDKSLRKCKINSGSSISLDRNNRSVYESVIHEVGLKSEDTNTSSKIDVCTAESNNDESTKVDKRKRNTYTCAICKKIFYNQKLLTEHIELHNQCSEMEFVEQKLTSPLEDVISSTRNFDIIKENDENNSDNETNNKKEGVEISKTETTYLEVDNVFKYDDSLLENDNNLDNFECNSADLKDFENAENKIKTEDYEIEFNSDDKSVKIKLRVDRRKRNSYTCNICQKGFTNKKLLKKHITIHQPHNTSYECKHCGKVFQKNTHLNVHLRSHITDEEKLFKCKECDRRFTFEYLLKQHMHKHSDKKPFPCTKCDKGCLTEDSLKRHMKIHNKDYKKPKYACTVCQKEFDYPSFLAEHMKNHTGEKPFLCSFCGKGFRQKGAFQYHYRIHTGIRPFQCHICDKRFTATGILKVHMRCHTNERPYICDICGKGFRQCIDMKSHKRTHTGDKLVECAVCQKKLAQRGQLKIHMRTHTGERPFQCTICGRDFATNTMLVKHTRIHTGEKPYVCKICGKAFAQSNTLKVHHRVHTKKKDIDSI